MVTSPSIGFSSRRQRCASAFEVLFLLVFSAARKMLESARDRVMGEMRRRVRRRKAEGRPGRDGETRQRLLDVAAELFADRGLDGVSVRELCTAAGANVAAINYHFGDKFGLYSELVEVAIERMRRGLSDAPKEGTPEENTPEERLAAYILAELQRALSAKTGPWVVRLMNREVEAPTPALDRVVREVIRPRVQYVSRLVAELMGSPVEDPRVAITVATIDGLSSLLRRGPIIERLIPRMRVNPEAIRTMADTTTKFVLAGIRELSKQRASPKRW
jgi:AcrR family transcriptional regulator